MKVKHILLVLPFLLLGVLMVNPAGAQPPSASITRAVELIVDPCIYPDVLPSGNSPAWVTCQSRANDLKAFIAVPVPHIVDRAPNLSLVSIPTFYRLTWDLDSLGYIDTAPRTYAYPSGDPTDRLVNLRLELRMMPSKPSPTDDEVGIENVVLNAVGLRIYRPGDNSIPDYVCDKRKNTLLAITSKQGGLIKDEDDNECQEIQDLLGSYPLNVPSLGDVKRYVGWNALDPSDVMTFSPYASIQGKGSDRGSPAFQLSATTSFIVEARLVWDEHREKKPDNETVCDWSFWNDYDFIDWDNWPDPVFCRREVGVKWELVCKPLEGNCPYGYGKPEEWWRPIFEETRTVRLLRRPDGTYAETYDFVSVQSQPLLTSP